MKHWIAALISVIPSFAFAAVSFVCTIEGYYPPSSTTEALGNKDKPIYVDRYTGEITHPWLGNTYYSNIVLLSSGFGGWGFKVISFSPRPDTPTAGGVASHYVEIETFAEGKGKPFAAISSGVNYWGTCR
jgi:hypothetical protein